MIKQYYFLLLAALGFVMSVPTAAEGQDLSHLSGTAEVCEKESPKMLKQEISDWKETPVLEQHVYYAKKSARKAPATLSGKTIYAAEFYQNMSDKRTLNEGGLLTFAYSDGTATVKGLGTAPNVLTMRYDLSAGTVSIAPQVVYKHQTYGDLYICPIDWSTKKYSTTSPLTGTIDADGNIALGAYGLFWFSNGTLTGYFIMTKGGEICASNGLMTNAFHQNPDSLEIYRVYVEQQFDNQIGIVNFAGNGVEVSAYVNPDKSIEITPQHIYTNASYGEFVCKPANWSGGGVLSGSINGTSTPTRIDLGNWAITSRAYSGLTAYYYESSKIEFDAFTLTYPTQRELTWKGEGTESSPYTITTGEQMQEFAESVNYGTDYSGKYVTLGNDIDLSTLKSAYRAIGRSEEKPFKGIFDGGGHTLRNLTITYGQESNAAIFGCVGKGGVVKNLTVDSLNLTSAGQFAGGAVAQATSAEIKDITVMNTTINHTNSYGGGIVGEMMLGTVSNCSFSGTINGSGATGGIVGILRGATVTKSHANASMTFDGYFDRFYRSMGGVAGYLIKKRDDNSVLVTPQVTDSYFSGTMADTDGHGQVGGVVGNMNGGIVERCFNAAPISTVTTDDLNGIAGGVAAMMNGATMRDCFSANELVARKNTKQAAGIVGYILIGNESVIENCYSAGQTIVSGGYPTYGAYGVRFQPSTLKNVYFDNQMTPSNMPDSVAYMSKTTAEMTTAKGLEGFSTDVWTFADGFYPVLTQFKDVPAAQMAVAPLFFSDKENVNKIKTSFKGAVKGNLKWLIYGSNGFTNDGTGLSVTADGTFTLKNTTSNEIIGVTPDNHIFKLFSVATVNPTGFVGAGTADSPYLIQDKEDLVTLNSYVVQGQNFKDEYFKQTKDIDLGFSEDFKGIGDDYNKSHLFNGTYDGQNFAIHRMKIDGVSYDTDGKAVYKNSRRVAGLFGYAGANSTIKNVTMAADNKIEVYSNAGGIVASTQGVVENCRNYADITTITNYAGGIAGEVTSTGTVRNCYNSGTVTAGSNTAGGIVAALSGIAEYCQNDGEVRAVYLTPTSAATANNTVGGISATASSATSVIRGCVNTGYVHSLRDVGGITAVSSRSKELSGCLNYGVVEYHHDNGSVGAIQASTSTGSSTSGNVFDSQLGYQDAAGFTSLAGCTGMTTAQLISGTAVEGLPKDYLDFTAGQYPVLKQFASETMAKAHRQMVVTFAANDNCDNVVATAVLGGAKGLGWSLKASKEFMIDGTNLTVSIGKGTKSLRDTLTLALSGYEKNIPLRAVPLMFDGDGTVANPYLIKTVDDMQNLGRFSSEELCSFAGKHFMLVNDLDFTGQTFYPVAKAPILFMAEFNGNGKKLKNVVYTTEEEYEAVFCNVGARSHIHDLTLASGTITGYRYVGGIAANVYGRISNCANAATVTTPKNPYAGGIAAATYSGAVIENCSNDGQITPDGGSGGGIVCNVNWGSVIRNCVNNASFTDQSSMSGIASISNGRIENCVNKGSIEGNSYLAGIVAKAYAGDTIINCVNEGDIKNSGSYTGGIVAYTNTSSTDISAVFINCHNIATVAGRDNVGGVAGMVRVGVEFYDCHNTGSVSGTGANVGGFVGSAYSSSSNNGNGWIERCYNTGTVTASGKDVGGFVGYAYAKYMFKNCYNAGDVSSQSYDVGGFAGTLLGVVENSYNSGNVKSNSYATGGFVGLLRSATGINACFNVGDVTSTYATADGAHGNAGGLVGEGYGRMSNSFNMGKVTAKGYAAGLLGMATSTTASIVRCYNAGMVSTDDMSTAGGIQMAGKKYVAATDSVYYDKEFCTGVSDTANVGRTTIQMESVDLGESFIYPAASYPLPAAFSASDTAAVYVAAYKLSDGETASEVKSDFTVAVPTGITWTCSDNLKVNGSTVSASATGPASVTKVFGGWTRTFNLNIAVANGITSAQSDGNIASRIYFNLNGVRMAEPQSGDVVIEKTVYGDGTTSTRKLVFNTK